MSLLKLSGEIPFVRVGFLVQASSGAGADLERRKVSTGLLLVVHVIIFVLDSLHVYINALSHTTPC